MTTRRLAGGPALQAIASPVRQELIAALGDGPATVRELAARLGRSPQALHHHMGILEKGGIVSSVDQREAGARPERVYHLLGDRFTVASRSLSGVAGGAAIRALQAMLRLTGREVVAALGRRDLPRHGPGREIVALRGKGRLGPSELKKLNRLIDELQAVLRSGRGSSELPVYAVTVVLTRTADRAMSGARSQRNRHR